MFSNNNGRYQYFNRVENFENDIQAEDQGKEERYSNEYTIKGAQDVYRNIKGAQDVYRNIKNGSDIEEYINQNFHQNIAPFFSDKYGNKIESIYITPGTELVLYMAMHNVLGNYVRPLLAQAKELQFLIDIKFNIISYGLSLSFLEPKGVYVGSHMDINNMRITEIKVIPNEQTVDYNINLSITTKNSSNNIKNIKIGSKIIAKPSPYNCLCK